MKKDLSGTRFGRWTVNSFSHRDGCSYLWNCTCDCGAARVVRAVHLNSGASSSCGCINADIQRSRAITVGGVRIRHTPLYHVWLHITQRCANPKAADYKWYGARGITVCPHWRDNSVAFFTWAMANGYERGLEIDRIDNDGNYEPSNCRWVTHAKNLTNRTDTVLIDGRCLSEVCRERGIDPSVVFSRKKYGWPESRWFEPIRKVSKRNTASK